jgi:hypothetical protein
LPPKVAKVSFKNGMGSGMTLRSSRNPCLTGTDLTLVHLTGNEASNEASNEVSNEVSIDKILFSICSMEFIFDRDIQLRLLDVYVNKVINDEDLVSLNNTIEKLKTFLEVNRFLESPQVLLDKNNRPFQDMFNNRLRSVIFMYIGQLLVKNEALTKTESKIIFETPYKQGFSARELFHKSYNVCESEKFFLAYLYLQIAFKPPFKPFDYFESLQREIKSFIKKIKDTEFAFLEDKCEIYLDYVTKLYPNDVSTPKSDAASNSSGSSTSQHGRSMPK